MLSRWTDFLNSDGEKNWRNRDDEFKHPLTTKEVIIESWETGWRCLFDAIEALKEKDLKKEVFIRNMGSTVQEALNILYNYANSAKNISCRSRLIITTSKSINSNIVVIN
ncbi:MAG: hypothetical protein ACI94N_000984 [Candidatus Arcticimaribacter sp.]|jgi:hypothetical protein